MQIIRKEAKNAGLIIILTGQDQDELNDTASLCGADATLCRPVFHSDIAELMAELTGQKSVQPEQETSTVLAGAQVMVVEDNDINLEIAVAFRGSGRLLSSDSDGRADAGDGRLQRSTGYPRPFPSGRKKYRHHCHDGEFLQ